MKEKSFITLPPGVNDIKLPFFIAAANQARVFVGCKNKPASLIFVGEAFKGSD